MHRISIDLPNSHVDDLTVIAKAERRSRAAVIRDAIEAYLAQHKLARGADVFGLWKDRRGDGVAYQRDLRCEW
ncbi:ribbon-helix-helix protein, CopG family [Paraburkholderia sp. UYCP14C]|nr:CopG family transcriptional regulator [Paraburkholderia sp. UYCP14C]RZF30975.1 ribbon-helix-helix protein, CopG family [Paraburkholderia sp. UYCP14C]